MKLFLFESSGRLVISLQSDVINWRVMEKKFRIRLIIIGIVFILFGVWGLLQIGANIHVIYRLGSIDQLGPFKAFVLPTFLGNMRMWIMPSVFILLGVSALGLIQGKLWAKQLSILLSSITALFYIIFIPMSIKAGLFFTSSSSLKNALFKAIIFSTLRMSITVLFFAYILYFLTRSRIKEQFKKRE